jgi:hypothetical protein
MQEAVSARTPAHLWIVGILSLLWSCFGAYDYVMTRMHNMDYLKSSMPGVDPQVALDWIDGMPMFAQFGWGLGVWSGLLGSLLLLMRSRFAVWAFAASMLGIVLGIGYQLVAAPPLPGASGTMYQVMPYVIIVVGVALLAFSQAMARKGVLR